MRKIIFAVAAIIVTNTVIAQTQQKIGYLNSSEIIQSMPEYKTMSESVEKKKTEYSKMMETMYAEYDKKTKDLQNNPNMDKTTQDLKVQELKDLEKRMNDFQQKAQGDLSTYAQEISKPLQSKFQDAVKEISKQEGFTYVLDLASNSVVYYPETGGFDLSPAVKSKLGASATPPPTAPRNMGMSKPSSR